MRVSWRRRIVKAGRLPQTKTLDDFDFSFQRSSTAERSPTSTNFLHEAKNVAFLGAPGTAKTHLPISSASKPPAEATVSRSHRPRLVQRLAAANCASEVVGADPF